MSTVGIILFSSLLMPGPANAGWRRASLQHEITQQKIQIAELESQIMALQRDLNALQQQVSLQQAAALLAPPTGDSGVVNNEATAATLLQDAQAQLNENNQAEALALLEIIETSHGQTVSAARATRYLKELRTIGMTVPNNWMANIDHWFQGSADLTNGTVLVVFWELWCPHCKREVPELNETLTILGPEGLQIVGLTKVSRNTSQEEVQGWLTEAGITVPIAKEDGDLAEYFNVSGIPAAAVIKDGTIVWRGHPGRLNNTLLRGWL